MQPEQAFEHQNSESWSPRRAGKGQSLDRVSLGQSGSVRHEETISPGRIMPAKTRNAVNELVVHEYRGLCLQALQRHITAAKATGSFSFPHSLETAGLEQPLSDGENHPVAAALSLYIRDECRAKFVDLASLSCWSEAAISLAFAVRSGMRATRWLTLDGNDIGSRPEVLEAWCAALEEHPGLQHVSLRNTGLTDNSAKSLAKVLRGHPVLFSLDIGLNRIGMTGAVALEDALGDNDVLVEVNCEECDLSVEMERALALALKRNRDRYHRAGGAVQALKNLRRTRAEAVAASAAFSLRVAQQREGIEPLSSEDAAPDTVLAMFAALEPGEEPFIYDEDQGNELCEAYKQEFRAEDEPDGVFFDAGVGVCIELNNRCEAGWRYSAADHEVLCELRRRIVDLKACRKHDRQRGEELRDRIASDTRQFRERIELPTIERLGQLREELAAVRQASDNVQKVCIQQKMILHGENEEYQNIWHEQDIFKVGAKHSESILKERNREVLHEVERLQQKLVETEAAADALAADNSRYRSWLHAARFETETERFAPRRAVEVSEN